MDMSMANDDQKELSAHIREFKSKTRIQISESKS